MAHRTSQGGQGGAGIGPSKSKRYYYSTGLNPAQKPSFLTPEEGRLRDEKLAAGVSIAAIANMLGRSAVGLRGMAVVDESSGAKDGIGYHEWLERENREREQGRLEARERRKMTTWHAEKSR